MKKTYLRKYRAKLLLVAIVILIILLAVGFGNVANAPAPSDTRPTAQIPQKSSEPSVSNLAINDPNDIQILVNKKRPLPEGFIPNDLSGVLRQEASVKLSELFASAQANNHSLKIISGYRSQAVQKNLYDSYVKKDGAAAADRYSARPRYSEHQTGLAVDVGNGTCDLQICFGVSPAGQWLADHAHEYGFIIRYPDGKETITGYQYEPWHLRYVGLDLAGKIKQTGKTMEQYFGLPDAPDY